MYTVARNNTGLSREAAADLLHVGNRTLNNYENGYTVPPADVVLEMSRVYNKPGLTDEYCKTVCPIGQAYCYIPLDNIDNSFTGIIDSLQEEMEEAMKVIREAKKLVKNRSKPSDFAESELLKLRELFMEIWDVEHNIEVLKVRSSELFPVFIDIETHNKKCSRKGYSTFSIKNTALALQS